MSNDSGTKYSWMSDEEFLRAAGGVVGIEVLDEALHRLKVSWDSEVAYAEELRMAEDGWLDQVYALNNTIGVLENRVEELESALEHA